MLTEDLVRAAEVRDRIYRIFDERGLYIEVSPKGSKYWRMKYTLGGREKRLAFGVWPEVSLEEARERRDVARRVIRDGSDPVEKKKESKRQLMQRSENVFEVIAREWHENQRAKWTDDSAKRVLSQLELDVFESLGTRPIEEITALELLKVMREIEKRDANCTARICLRTCGRVFKYAIVTGRAKHDVSHGLNTALKPYKAKNHKHLPEGDLPEFIQRLEGYSGNLQTKLALKLLVLTFLRTNEVRYAQWEEINFEKKEWRIPAARMKLASEHIVPLSEQVVEVLKQMQAISGDRSYVFPGRVDPKKPMSENAMLFAMYSMGYRGKATVHGFRATASTILNENGFKGDVIERQLAHLERNKIRAAYNHAEYLPERRVMMDWWGNYLDGQKKVPI